MAWKGPGEFPYYKGNFGVDPAQEGADQTKFLPPPPSLNDLFGPGVEDVVTGLLGMMGVPKKDWVEHKPQQAESQEKEMTPKEVANKILRWLDGKRADANGVALFYPTSVIVEGTWGVPGSKFPSKWHIQVRDTLMRLASLGYLDKYELHKSSHKWKLIVEEWDEYDPLTVKSGGGGFSAPPKDYDQAASQAPIDSGALDALREQIEELRKGLAATSDSLAEARGHIKLLEAANDQKSSFVKVLEIKKWDGKVVKLKNKVLPKVYDRIVQLARNRRNIMLVGPAGCGKSYLGKLVADSLDLAFGSLSCTGGMSEAHLLGRAVPDLTHGKNRFQGTSFLKCYEEGGVFLLDEMDAADPNLLLAINTALANRYCNVPNRVDKPTAVRHDDFVLIATANTFGRGATRMYAGRSQLDEATLDRFRIGMVECDYDPAIELALCPDDAVRTWCQAVRAKIRESGLRRVMSSRFLEDAYVMVKNEGWSLDVVKSVFFEGWTEEEKAKVEVPTGGEDEKLDGKVVKLKATKLEEVKKLLSENF